MQKISALMATSSSKHAMTKILASPREDLGFYSATNNQQQKTMAKLYCVPSDARRPPLRN